LASPLKGLLCSQYETAPTSATVSLPRRLQRTCLLDYSSVRHSTSGLTETRRKSPEKISSAPRTNAINIHSRRPIPTKCGTRFLHVDCAGRRHVDVRYIYFILDFAQFVARFLSATNTHAIASRCILQYAD